MLPRPDSSLLKPISDHPRTCLVLSVLSLQLLLLFSTRVFPISAPSPSAIHRRSEPIKTNTTPAAATNDDDPSCPLGRIFVYELPPLFNADLVAACDGLDRWHSRCAALSNFGFGPPAADLADLVPLDLLPSWFATDQFAGELIYHHRMLSHPCRTTDPSSALAFYVPFYGGLAVGKYLWSTPTTNYTALDRDRLCRLLLQWLSRQPPWRRSGGGNDHFLMLGRITWDFRRTHDEDWGGSFLYMPEMANVTRLVIERDPWDEMDVGVPYPTGFHPRTPSDILQWQRHVLRQNRTTLYCFAGAARANIKNDFRTLLLDQCAAEKKRCRSLDCSGTKCSNGTGEALSLFLTSEFCLQPRGDSYTRRSIFDCMVAGAVPVFFWRRSAYDQYEWFLPGEGEYSVMLDRGEVRNGTVRIGEVLEGIGAERRRRMRESVVGMMPRLVYGSPGMGVADAFDVAVDGVMRRFRERMGRRRTRGAGGNRL